MKNYVLLTLFIIIVIIIATGCTRNNHNETPTTSTSDSTVSSMGSDSQQAPVSNSSPTPSLNVSTDNSQTEAPSNNINYDTIGRTIANDCLTYMFGGRGRTPNDFIDILGEPIKEEVGRWYFEQDVQIDVFGDAAEIGNYVYLGENCELKTDRDIGIGSTYDKVQEAYRNEINPEQTDKNLITVGEKHDGIFFVIKDDKVSSIYISTGEVTPEYAGYFSPDRP